MNFDWLQFFDSLGIDYVLGPAINVRQGNAGINCPQCGNDTKNHFSVELETGKTRGCWRDPGHWMSPADLVANLAGVNWREAKEMMKTGDIQSGNSPQALLKQLEALGSPKQEEYETCVEWPKEFQAFVRSLPHRHQGRFEKYLMDRGFDNAPELTDRFGIAWCSRGEWQNRIIIPIYDDDKLLGWTARAVGPSRMKYKAFPAGDALRSALLLSRPVRPSDLLVIVEGPTDLLRIGQLPGVCCVALLTNSAGSEKVRRLIELGSVARRTVLLLDEGAEAQALRLQARLTMIGAEVDFQPDDPGSMSMERAESWLAEFLAGVTP